MNSLKVGDNVIAARRAEGSSVLTGVEHRAKVLAFTAADRYGRRFVTVQYEQQLDGFPDIDTIKMKSGKGGNATVLPAPPAEDESPLLSSQSSAASSSSELPATQRYSAAAAAAADDAAAGSEPGCKWTPEWERKVPRNFGETNALHLLRAKVPDHILHRWQAMSKDFTVQELFATNANSALRDVHLTCLKDLVGTTEYSSVPVKSGQNMAPNFGLTELFVHQSIGGRTGRARFKGLMFFYLMCRHPEQVVWPEFVPTTDKSSKRRRCQPFSLAEIGRLIAIVADQKNMALVSMLFKKWKRSELDSNVGRKGAAYYWDQLAKLYNDGSYVPIECAEFKDHVDSCGTASTYSTRMLPEYRAGDNLRTKWTSLKAGYALFHANYNRSGHNEPDPRKYTSELPVLLMHYTFHDTPFESWAAKRLLHGSIDDAGDGEGGGPPKKSRKKKVDFTFSADTVIATSTLYETLANRDHGLMTDEQLEEHQVRMRRATKLMDMCLDKLENM